MKVLIIGGTGLISTGIVKALAGTASITVLNRGKTHCRLPGDVRRMTGDRNEAGTVWIRLVAIGPKKFAILSCWVIPELGRLHWRKPLHIAAA